jgi:pseudouridine kinase
MDVVARSTEPVEPGTSNPGTTHLTPGGVGRNIAENLARLGIPVRLVAAVGDDAFGDAVLRATADAGVDIGGVRRDAERTGTYTALLDDRGELVAAVSDMAATDGLDVDDLDLAGAEAVVLDGNLAVPTARHVADLATKAGVSLAVEPVSAPKARRLAALLDRPVDWLVVTPNEDELAALTGRARDDRDAAIADLHAAGVRHVWLRRGPAGSTLSTAGSAPVDLESLPTEVVDVTGAGDSMLAAFLAALLRGADPVEAARHAHRAARATIESPHTVRPDIAAVLEGPR